MSGAPVAGALLAVGAPLRWRARAAGAAAGAAMGVAVLAVSAWLLRTGWLHSPAWILASWSLALGALAAGTWWGWYRARALRPLPLAALLESSGRFREGALRLLLEERAGGTSEALQELAEHAVARAVRADGPAALGGLAHALRRAGTRAAAALAGAALLLVLADPLGGPAAALWRPVAALRLAAAPVRLEATATAVDRGSSVTYSMAAPGRTGGTLWLRSPGEAWREVPVRLGADGTAAHTAGPLEGDQFAWFESGGRATDTLHVAIRLPVFLATLQVTALYPGYLRLEPEGLPVSGDTILLPVGTRLATTGRASAPLSRAAWVRGSERASLAVDGAGFAGDLLPAGDGTWQLEILDATGQEIGGFDGVLAIRMVPDLPPRVEVPLPALDTLLVLDTELPLVVDVRDDHGLTSVVLESRRGREPARRQALEVPPGAPDQALLAAVLDLSRLAPGDTLHYRVVALDNSPARQLGASRERVVVIPTRGEVRALQQEATDDLGRQLDSLARQGRALERQTEDLARTRDRGPEAGRAGAASLSFEDARRAGEVARSQEDLLEQVEQLRRELDEMARAADAAGIADSAFLRRLEEIREELRRALSPELRDKLAELQEALRNLDAPAAREAMRQLAEVQQQMREALERSRELFERAALERELGALEQEAGEVAEAQRAWTDSVRTAELARAAASERALAARADSLAAGMEGTASRLDSEQAREQLAQVAGAVREAAELMRQAAQGAAQGQRQQAREQGQRAQAQLAEAGQAVSEQRGQQQQEWREEVVRALDQALLETARLTQRQLRVLEGLRAGGAAAALRADQAVLEEGVRQLLEQVMTAGGRNALVPPRIAGALAAARLEMSRARDAISTATVNVREGASRAGDAVDALHVAAWMLLRARSDVAGASSGSGMAEAMERMAQLAQQQGGIGEDASGMMSMLNMPGMDQQLVELAARQRQVARDLDRLRAETDAAAAEALAEEARELARQLEAGRLDPATVARQERLFRRMLDAGRMLQGEEQDEQKERQGRTAEGIEALLPASLRDQLRDAAGRIRPPTWEELQRYSPEERRLVTDYFRRLRGGAP